MSKVTDRGADSQIELGMRLEAWFRGRNTDNTLAIVQRLRAAFNVSRATAYRYIAAHRKLEREGT